MIHAPFNFVPLPDKVLFPDWADQISQDVPFSDGISGTIELNITAKNPIFVRNGCKKNIKENKFSNINDSYFIPGSTLKGTFRTALEILSFGKFSRYGEYSFAFRDLGNTTDGKNYKTLIRKEETHGGWLYQKNGQFYILDCGKINKENRICVYDIDKIFESNVFEEFVEGRNFGSDENKTAKKKYSMLGDNYITDSEKEKYKKGETFYYIKDKGYLVFTGQPGPRKQGVGKYKEFLFSKSPDNINPEEDLKIPSEDISAFQSIHCSSPDFEFWKNNLKRGKPIPVFFQKTNDRQHYYIGLSYMFKYPTKYSVKSIITKHINASDLTRQDMADLIFGFQQQDKCMRGRVQVGHAFIPKGVKEESLEEYDTKMFNPRPSYYPLYLKWNEKPVTWNDDLGTNVEIAGYKRYPIRECITDDNIRKREKKGKPNDRKWEEKSKPNEVSMKPLPEGTTFAGKIVFHNLRPVELGALLYSISLCNPQQGKTLYHNIGAYKPYGYGKIEIKPTLRITEGRDLGTDYYYNLFSKFMENLCDNRWESSDTIRQLQAMAEGGIPEDKKHLFSYMKMSTKREYNEFLHGKEAYAKGERLGSFTDIINNTVKEGSKSSQSINYNNNGKQEKRNGRKWDKPKKRR